MENDEQYHSQTGEVLYAGDDEALAVDAVNRGMEKLGSPLRVAL